MEEIEINTQKTVLLYDKQCSLCQRFKSSLEKIDTQNKIELIDLHNPKVYQVFPFLKLEDCLEEIHLVLPTGEVLKGSNSVKHLIGLFPSVSKFSWLIESEVGEKSVDFFYQMTNKLRDKLRNRCSDCKTKRKNKSTEHRSS
jgi:predicted DCC family thiol-disulfide oxidoreductase YuxK